MSEAWKMYYSYDDIKKIQKIELEMLKEFQRVCDTLEIPFFLYGGSLLGAVKYQGFVPWDDDLDIALLRDDYEKLIRLGPSILADGYELQHPRLTKRTPYPYIKLRKSGTKMVEYFFRNVKINHGVYFDIYPIDNISDSDSEIEAERKRVLFLCRVLRRKQSYSLFTPERTLKNAIRFPINVFMHVALKVVPQIWIMNLIDKIMQKHNSEKTCRQGNLFYPRPVNYFDGIKPFISSEFEEIDVLLPKGYELNLKNRYGDINLLPPENERVGHRPYILELDCGE